MTTGEIIGLSFALLVMLVGLIGCIVPGFPGTPLVLVAAVGHRLYFGPASVSNLVLGTLIALTVLSLVFDFVAGMVGARKLGATWLGMTGAVVGGLIGLFFSLPGIILGPFLGALLFELIGGREMDQAAKAGLGATIGLFVGIVGRFATGVVMILLFATNAILRSVN
jgi:uncharacterized protein YqgC (DUF456 family)